MNTFPYIDSKQVPDASVEEMRLSLFSFFLDWNFLDHVSL